MSPENWSRIKELFDAALELDCPQRVSFLVENCHEESLRQQVEQLLLNYEEAGSFLDDPALNPRIPVPNGPPERQLEGAPDPYPALGELLATITSAEADDPMVGRQLGAYKLVRRIGQGGMAAVFLASRADDEYRHQVAVKLVQPGLDGSDVLSRFRNERQTLAGLDHPNIVKLLDGGTTPEGLPFLVMDYVEGSPIDEYCDRHKLSVDERLNLFGKVCAAVHYAHQKLVIHRDLKPSNILVVANGTPKLLDFGIAKVLNPEPTAQDLLVTQTGTRCMTPAYASPEQMRGTLVTPATDIYSLGVVLYELLTGHRPYRLTQLTPGEMERAICEQEPETPSIAVSWVESVTSSDGRPITKTPELVSQTREGQPDKLRRRLRGDLDSNVLKALEKEPKRRYGSVEELARDIDQHLKHLPVTARPSTLGYRVSKFIQRHKIEVSAALILALVLVAAALGVIAPATVFISSPRTKKLSPSVKVVTLTSNVGDEVSPSFSPDGNQITYSWNGEKQDISHVYVKLISPGPPRKLTNNAAHDFWPAWSPDGQTIAFMRDFGSGTYGIYLIPALGGQETKLWDVFLPESLFLRGPFLAWLPDSKWLVYTNRDAPDHTTRLFMLNVDTRESRRVTAPPEGTIGDSKPAVSPDGSRLVFSRLTGLGPEDLFILKLDPNDSSGSEPQRISFFNSDVAGVAWTPGGRNLVFSREQELWKLAFSKSGSVASEPQKIEWFGSGGTSPAIARLGNRVAYVKGYGGPLNIWQLGLDQAREKGDKRKAANEAIDLIPSTSSEFAPQYSPDGKRIAFESDRTGSLEIWTCQSDGSNCLMLTSFGKQATGVPHWSPDGRQIVFYSRPDGNAQIYIINSDSSGLRRLTNDKWENFYPVWSRDGRWIYFASNRTGTDQVWKELAGGGEPVQVTMNGGFASAESVDGRYVYYTRSKDALASLWKLPVDGGEESKIVDGVVITNFSLTARGLYYMSQPDPRSGTKLVQFLGFGNQHPRVVATIKQNVYAGFSLSPDERWLLYAPSGRGGSNIMLVENSDLEGGTQ
ncbi:MAG: protein kinase [Bryobacteraceae bacterium]